MNRSEFDLHAKLEDSHWWFTGRRAILLDTLHRHIPPQQGALLAEIGCGTGGNLKLFRKDYNVIGCDLSPDAVTYARERVDGEIFLGDFEAQLAGYWGKISGVLLLDVLEHLDDAAVFLARIIRLAKPGTIFLLTVPAHQLLWSRHDEVLGHRRRYSAAQFRRLWLEQPVKQLQLSPIISALFPAIALYRRAGLGNSKAEGESNLKAVSPLLNSFLYHLVATERYWLRCHSLPFGSSLMAVLRKQQ